MDSTTKSLPKALHEAINGKPIIPVSFDDTVTEKTRIRHSEMRYVYLTEHDKHVRLMGDRMLGMGHSLLLCRQGEEVFCANVSSSSVFVTVLPSSMKSEGFKVAKRHHNKPLRHHLDEGKVYTWTLDSLDLVEKN